MIPPWQAAAVPASRWQYRAVWLVLWVTLGWLR